MSATSSVVIDLMNERKALVNREFCHCTSCEEAGVYVPDISDYETDEEFMDVVKSAPFCGACNDTGRIPSYRWDNDSHQFIDDDSTKCWCRLDW